MRLSVGFHVYNKDLASPQVVLKKCVLLKSQMVPVPRQFSIGPQSAVIVIMRPNQFEVYIKNNKYFTQYAACVMRTLSWHMLSEVTNVDQELLRFPC